MEINISELKLQLNSFRRKINEYDKLYLNLYNEINYATSSWQDPKANSFFSCCEEKRKKIQKTISELNEFVNIYQYIVNKYESLGEKIKIILKNKDSILAEMDKYIDGLESVISSYQKLSLWFCPNEAYILNKQLSKIKENKMKIENVKKELKNVFDLVEDTEREVNIKISKINIEILKGINVNEYV